MLSSAAFVVQVVVVDNFDEIVNDPTKDVLLDFYIPTCGGCVQLEPVLVEVAEKVINSYTNQSSML